MKRVIVHCCDPGETYILCRPGEFWGDLQNSENIISIFNGFTSLIWDMYTLCPICESKYEITKLASISL